jgi:hypothetical protein
VDLAKGLLIAAFNYANVNEDEFHDWYDLEHIPERQAVSGFGNCERWIGAENSSESIATYDLDTIEVLRSDAYRAIAYGNLSPWSKRVTGKCDRILRFEGVQILPGEEESPTGAGGLLVFAVNVAANFKNDFNSWYTQEHIPALLEVPGVLSARRFMGTEGSHQYIAVYHLDAPEVTKSEAWSKAIDTPWSSRIRPHYENGIRILARKYKTTI